MHTEKYRTIWLSDIHLGSKGCQAEQLLQFLKTHDSEYLILVGDIIDFWALKRQSFWPESHNTVVQKILKKARHGTKVIFIPGNHDEVLREYTGLTFGGIEVCDSYMHELTDGRKIFCIHGDQYDVITRYHKWIAVLGDIGYTSLLWVNRIHNKFRNMVGLDYWSLSSYIKYKVKEAVNFIGDYENTIAKHAKEMNVYGILCGHIHHAEIKMIDNVLYMNTGDWVESCTALVEDNDGYISLINWKEQR